MVEGQTPEAERKLILYLDDGKYSTTCLMPFKNVFKIRILETRKLSAITSPSALTSQSTQPQTTVPGTQLCKTKPWRLFRFLLYPPQTLF